LIRRLPPNPRGGGGLYLIGIGRPDAAAEFSKRIGADPSRVFADDGAGNQTAAGFHRGIGSMWNPGEVYGALSLYNLLSRDGGPSFEELVTAYGGAARNVGLRQLFPSHISDALRQGGTFVFQGDVPLIAHFESKVGDFHDIDSIVRAASAPLRQ